MIEELPDGWAESTVGELSAEIQYGYTASADESTHGPRFLRITDIQNGSVDWRAVPSCEITANDVEKYRLQRGDLVFARTGATTGKSYLIGECPTAVFASYLIRLRPKPVIDPQFLSYFFQTPEYWAYIFENVSGNAQPSCNASKLAEIPIQFPPLAEQRRIVAKIEELTARSRAARAALAEVPTLLEQFRQSVLAAAFRGDLTADWRAKHPHTKSASELLAHIRTERRKQWEAKYPKKKYFEPDPVDDSDLPELPGSWCWTTVEEISSLITSGSRDWSKYYDRGTGTFIMAQNVRPGRLDFSEVRQFVDPPPENRDRERSQVQPGDLLITIVGANTGDICPVLDVLPEHFVCQSVALIRLAVTEIQGFILRYFLQGAGGRKALEEVIYGQGRPHLGFDDLQQMPVPLAPLKEQQELLRIVRIREAAIERILDACHESEQTLQQLDQSILAKAFRGELVPQDPADEPASELLERIRSTPVAKPDKQKGGKTGKTSKRQKGEANMLSRNDIKPNHLAAILSVQGPLIAESLWKASQLDIDDFYDQLKAEEEEGLLKERRGGSTDETRLLEVL